MPTVRVFYLPPVIILTQKAVEHVIKLVWPRSLANRTIISKLLAIICFWRWLLGL